MGTDDVTDGSTDGPTTDERPARGSFPRLRIASDRYRIGESIGHGGMGEVYAAHDEQLGRDVAIKRLRASDPTDRQITRFLREARIQARLDHPAIVPVHEVGRDVGGLPFFAMKKLAGTTLADILRAGPVPLQRLLRAFADVCLAVELAHTRGVIHRDLKPENILLGDFGEVYVLDWGVAKVAGGGPEDFDDLRGPHTVTGTVIGTPSYMSPEQARDSAGVDARADVFSLGRVLAAILSRTDEPPPELLALAGAATVDDRDARIASARELGEQVQRYLDGDRDLELRRKLARAHLDHARAAFAAGLADSDRPVAIRAASSAMALDPTLTGAAELVGRLMLEPPRDTPAAVEDAIRADDTDWTWTQSKAATWVNLIAVVLVVPLLVAMGTLLGAALVAAVSVFGSVTNVVMTRDRATFQPPSPTVLAFGNAIVVVIFAYVFSPWVGAPAIAAILTFLVAANPFLVARRHVAFTGVAMVLAIVVPVVVGELAGMAQITITEHGMLVDAPARLRPWMLVPATVLFQTAIVVAATMVGRTMRSHERELRRRLHLQAWQLRQLVA
jgi:serine/threonine-protein kinase